MASNKPKNKSADEVPEVERQATLAECNANLHASMLAIMQRDAAKKGEIVREVVYMPAPILEPALPFEPSPPVTEDGNQDNNTGPKQDATTT